MAILGFPNEAEISSMMGFVTDEDRDKWDQMKAASDKNLAATRNGLTARGLASQAALPGMNLAEQAVNSRMRAAHNVQADRTTGSRARVRETIIEETPITDDYQPGGF